MKAKILLETLLDQSNLKDVDAKEERDRKELY